MNVRERESLLRIAVEHAVNYSITIEQPYRKP